MLAIQIRTVLAFLVGASDNIEDKIVTRPLFLVESFTLEAAIMQVRYLFLSVTFCKTSDSCSLISKERRYFVPLTCVSLIDIPAMINLY